MALRDKLQATATRLIGNATDERDEVFIVAETITPGATEFDPPLISTVDTRIDAIVTGAGSWVDGDTILMSDLRVVVSGFYDLVPVGGSFKINGKNHVVKIADPKLATGVKSAVIYFVRRG